MAIDSISTTQNTNSGVSTTTKAANHSRQTAQQTDSGRPVALDQVNRALSDNPELREVVASFNDIAERFNRHVEFSVDEDSGRTVIKIVDADRDTVIRQLPPEEILNLSKYLRDAQGLILQAEV